MMNNNDYPRPQPTVTIAQIDCATTEAERIALMRTCITEENQACLSTNGIYWAVSEPLTVLPHTLSENLVWETMNSGPRPIFHHQIFHINNGKFDGYIDIKTLCSSIARHHAERDIHKCINRGNSCFKVELDVLSYTVHPLPDVPHPTDLDIFHNKLHDKITMIYSHEACTGRIVTCGTFYSYVPPFLATSDGLIPSNVLRLLLNSNTIVPDITALLQ